MSETQTQSAPASAPAPTDLFQAILDSANYAIIATDSTGLITVYNRAAERMLGYPAEDVIGKERPMMWHEPKDIHEEAVARGLLNHPGFDIFIAQAENFATREYERFCITKDGRRIPVLSSVSAIRNPNGEITGFLAIAHDITDRKKVEQALREENAFRKAIETAAPIAIATAGLDGTQTYVNPAFCKLVGYTQEELTGRNIPRLYWHPDAEAHHLKLQEKVLADRFSPAQFEMLLRHKDGRAVNVISYVSPLVLESGDMTGWLAIYLDITEKKRIEQNLAESDARFRTAFAESASGMSLVNPEGRWLMVNSAACEITGYTEEELSKTTWQAITHPDDLDKDLLLAQELLANKRTSYQMEKRYIHKSGKFVWIHLTVSLIRDQFGKPLYFCSQFQDITARKEQDRQLRAAKEAAESASLAKSAFLANISHEIRTPLNAIAGFAEVLERGDLDPSERQEFAQTIRRNSEHLLAVLNDILDVSKIEAGKMTIELLPVALRPVLEDVCAMLQPKADAKGLELYCKKTPDLPPTIVSDPTRLRQILLNLLGNAIKFTDHGSVTVRTSLASPTMLKIEVIDTGIGISREQQKSIFEPFTQVDVSHSRRFGGVGLGLAISQRLANLLGGDIRLQSAAGQGSTFILQLPIRLSTGDTGAAEPPSAIPVRSARVLVAEDSLDSQRLMQFLLQRMEMEVVTADNGQAALDAIDRANADGKPIEMVLMDMQMPIIDGYTATPMLRQRGYTGPIIALTANATQKDSDHCLNIGCDEFLTKPVQLQALRDIVQHYFSSESPVEDP